MAWRAAGMRLIRAWDCSRMHSLKTHAQQRSRHRGRPTTTAPSEKTGKESKLYGQQAQDSSQLAFMDASASTVPRSRSSVTPSGTVTKGAGRMRRAGATPPSLAARPSCNHGWLIRRVPAALCKALHA